MSTFIFLLFLGCIVVALLMETLEDEIRLLSDRLHELLHPHNQVKDLRRLRRNLIKD